jgi:large subunit ribosomal protein L21
MAFAIIETGGKQYKVAEGEALVIEKLAGDFKEGDEVVFDKVLVLDDGSNTTLGAPYIEGAKVTATFQTSGKAKRILVQKFKRKTGYMRRYGHRQPQTKVKVSKI